MSALHWARREPRGTRAIDFSRHRARTASCCAAAATDRAGFGQATVVRPAGFYAERGGYVRLHQRDFGGEPSAANFPRHPPARRIAARSLFDAVVPDRQ